MTSPNLLHWARRVAALAQNGLAYRNTPFDTERYEELRVIAAEMMATATGGSVAETTRVLGAEVGYATPKVDVRAAVFRDGKLLLVNDAMEGAWTLPGGWLDVGEAPARGAEREAFEESGYVVRATRLLAVVDRNRPEFQPHAFAIVKLVYGCELVGGEATTSHETLDVGFFGRDELPAIGRDRASPELVARLFDLAEDGAAPADFD